MLPSTARAPDGHCLALMAVTAAQYERLFRFLSGEVKSMLRWAVIFLVIALVTAVFGSTDIAAGAAAIAKLLVFLFSVMCVILFILGMAAEGRMP